MSPSATEMSKPIRLSVKKRKFVVDTMRKEIMKEKMGAARGTKKMVNKLAADYRKSIFDAVKKTGADEKVLVDHIISIRNNFKSGLKAIDDRDKVLFEPLRDSLEQKSQSNPPPPEPKKVSSPSSVKSAPAALPAAGKKVVKKRAAGQISPGTGSKGDTQPKKQTKVSRTKKQPPKGKAKKALPVKKEVEVEEIEEEALDA